MEAILEDLASIRVDVASMEEEDTFFYLHVRGGIWTRVHLKTTSDAIALYARGGSSSRWCDAYSFPKQSQFAYDKFGVMENVTMLAKELSRRAHYFIYIFLDSGDKHYVYTREDLESYEEFDEFKNLMAGLCDGDPAKVRGQIIRNTFPRL